MSEHVTVEIAVGDDDENIAIPTGVLEALTQDELTLPEIIGDLIIVSCTQRLHGMVAHGAAEPDEDLVELEAEMREVFEDRFGASFAELTGHSH